MTDLIMSIIIIPLLTLSKILLRLNDLIILIKFTIKTCIKLLLIKNALNFN